MASFSGWPASVAASLGCYIQYNIHSFLVFLSTIPAPDRATAGDRLLCLISNSSDLSDGSASPSSLLLRIVHLVNRCACCSWNRSHDALKGLQHCSEIVPELTTVYRVDSAVSGSKGKQALSASSFCVYRRSAGYIEDLGDGQVVQVQPCRIHDLTTAVSS